MYRVAIGRQAIWQLHIRCIHLSSLRSKTKF